MNKLKPFYCKPATEEEAVEICKRAAANGAEKHEAPLTEETSRDNFKRRYTWNTYCYWGVDSIGRTLTSDDYEAYGSVAEELTIHQVRERYTFPDEVKREFGPGEGKEVEGYFSCPPSRNASWHKCVPIYCNSKESNEFAVIHHRSSLHWCDEFRPLKTESEIKREKAIESLTADICNLSDMCLVPANLLAERFIKEGYIKPRELTDDHIDKFTQEFYGDLDLSSFEIGARWAEKHIKGEE
mgnify:CR=1 FL=1